jgi:site-specific DNA-adenine methylase
MAVKAVIQWKYPVQRYGSESAVATVSSFPSEIDTYYEPFFCDGLVLYTLLSSHKNVKNYLVGNPNKLIIGFWHLLKANPTFLSSYYKSRWREYRAQGTEVLNLIYDSYSFGTSFPEQLFILSHFSDGIAFDEDGDLDVSFTGNGKDPEEMEQMLTDWSNRIQNVQFKYTTYDTFKPLKGDYVHIAPSCEPNHDKLYAWIKTLPCKYDAE